MLSRQLKGMRDVIPRHVTYLFTITT